MMNQYMEALMVKCHDSGIHKHYSKANTIHGCFFQYWASINYYLGFNSRQSILKWSIYVENYESEGKNTFFKTKCLMVKESVLPITKNIPRDLKYVHHLSWRIWTYGNQIPDQNVWRHTDAKNTLLGIIYLDTHMSPEHVGQWNIFPFMSCQVTLIS